MIKLCKDCKHLEQLNWFKKILTCPDCFCDYSIKESDYGMIDGKSGTFAYVMRGNPFYCGKEAKFFEPKEDK